MKIYKTILLFIFFSLPSANTSAENIQGINQLKIKITPSALGYDPFIRIDEKNGKAALINPAFCLSVDDRGSINHLVNHPFLSNPVLPGIKISVCSTTEPRQTFKYKNRSIVGSDGSCLTRLTQITPISVLDPTGSRLSCGGTRGEASDNEYKLGLAMEVCTGNPNQAWSMSITEENHYQISNNGSCLALTGKGPDRAINYTKALNPETICNGYLYSHSSISIYRNSFDIGLKSCNDNASTFSFDSPVIRVERIVPIIMPM